jgi:hypothetical protein
VDVLVSVMLLCQPHFAFVGEPFSSPHGCFQLSA